MNGSSIKRIPSLDGLRAISIIMVLLSHLGHTIPRFIQDTKPYFLLSNAVLGVNIFFVLSGYLITTILMKERLKRGDVSLKDFYIKRIFRIFPVFYIYIIILIILKELFLPSLFSNYSLVVASALYLWNYVHLFNINNFSSDHALWFFGHFWSLSLEEQFYLLWPLMFIKIRPINLIKVVIYIITVMPIIRLLTYYLMPGSRGQIGMMIQSGGDSILIGCLAALVEGKPTFERYVNIAISSRPIMVCLIIFLFILSPLLSLYVKGLYDLPIGMSLNNIAIVIFMHWCVRKKTAFSEFLNTKIMTTVGLLSYSIYIWQQLFLSPKPYFWANLFPQNIILAITAAVISYFWIEKPILGLKTHILMQVKQKNQE